MAKQVPRATWETAAITTLLVDGNGKLRMAIPGVVPYHVLKTVVDVLVNESKEPADSVPSQADANENAGDGQ